MPVSFCCCMEAIVPLMMLVQGWRCWGVALMSMLPKLSGVEEWGVEE